MVTAEQLVPRFLRWFAQNARALPWRRTSDPYAIWISEVMLQQTQVQTVLSYWERWMQEMPDVLSLARAPADRVLKLWEGLGYYSRVRNLQRAAQAIIAQGNSEFPRDFETLLELPGIGRYTAGAICSIAFDQPRAILDGNIVRVLTRVYGIAGPVRSPKVHERLWTLAQTLVNAAAARRVTHLRPCRALNEALMELGATVCRPKQPACDLCPVADWCRARKTGRVDRLPNLAKRPPATQRRFAAFVVLRRGRVLVQKRPAGGVNGHLWEFPNLEIHQEEGTPESRLQTCCGFVPAQIQPLCTIRHSITRYRIRVDAFLAEGPNRINGPPGSASWRKVEELDALAFTSAHRKILTTLLRDLAGSGRDSQRPSKRGHREEVRKKEDR